MKPPLTAPVVIAPADAADAGDAQLHGHWLRLARAGWVALTVALVGLAGAGMPAFYRRLRTLEDTGIGGDPVIFRANLEAAGLSTDVYATLILATHLGVVSTFLALAIVLFRRGGQNSMALYAASMLVLLGMAYSGGLFYDGAGRFVGHAGFATLFLFFYLFPDGHFVPRWARWLPLLGIGRVAVAVAFPGSRLDFGGESLPLFTVEMAGWLGLGLAAQIYRYRWHSSPAQRQQAKWVVGGLAAGLGGFIGAIFLSEVLFPGLAPAGSPPDLAARMAGVGSFVFIPLSLTMAILRLRLWEIDRLINRALVYGALTASLALVYFGSVVLLQRLVGVLTGQQESRLAIVASTLAIAALFQPLRRRLQVAIDRRFYRRRYDAAQILTAFSATLRDETNLEKITADLLAVVQETVQPAHVSLWLRPPAGRVGEPERTT